jgi:molybdopterin molybdotransferase
MDGFAVKSNDIRAGVVDFRVLETIVAGTMPTQAITAGTASRIMTGAPMPNGADAVVMVELSNVGYSDPTPEVVTLKWNGPPEKFTAGKHAMQRAVNFAKGQTIFDSGHKVRAVDVGLLAEVGADQVAVSRMPTVAVLPTGDELVDCSLLPGDSQIRNSNGPMLNAVCREMGANVIDLGIGADSVEDLTTKIKNGLEQDFLLLSGGVSAGTMDLVPGILQSQGVVQVFHKVKVKPGKPIFFGVLERTSGRPCLVFGLPGNPVSSLVGVQLFVSTALRMMTGQTLCRPVGRPAVLSAPHQTRGDRPTYWPGRVATLPDSAPGEVEPLRWKGSSDLFSLGAAEGLILMPPREDTWGVGEQVLYFPFG